MAVINQDKGLKMYAIPDNSRVDPHIQELQLSLEKIEKGAMTTLCSKKFMSSLMLLLTPLGEDFIEMNNRLCCLVGRT